MIDSQINRYKGAVGHRNVGSQPSQSSVNTAKNTAIGRNRGTIDSSPRPSSKPKGSWEGYMGGGYSTYLQANGTGYDAPSAQKARGARIPQDFSRPSSVSLGRNQSFNTFDYRLCGSAGSAHSKLKSLTKLSRVL